MKIMRVSAWVVVMMAAATSVLLANLRAQQPGGASSLAASMLTRSIQVDWLSAERSRVTLTGQDNVPVQIEAATVTLTAGADGLKVSGNGGATLSSSRGQLGPLESLDMIIWPDGSTSGSIRPMR